MLVFSRAQYKMYFFLEPLSKMLAKTKKRIPWTRAKGGLYKSVHCSVDQALEKRLTGLHREVPFFYVSHLNILFLCFCYDHSIHWNSYGFNYAICCFCWLRVMGDCFFCVLWFWNLAGPCGSPLESSPPEKFCVCFCWADSLSSHQPDNAFYVNLSGWRILDNSESINSNLKSGSFLFPAPYQQWL